MNDKQKTSKTKWSQNVIVADADYVDSVAFNLTVNFERVLMRPVAKADLAQWLVCVALDGGMTDKNAAEDVTVVLVHDKKVPSLDNFKPSHYADELDGQAFADRLGEFAITALPVEPLTTKGELMLDVVKAAIEGDGVKRLMVVPDGDDETLWNDLRHLLRQLNDDMRVTLFNMQPMSGGNFRQEMLGYSLLQALGISAADLEGKM